jgi:hypothetical protein
MEPKFGMTIFFDRPVVIVMGMLPSFLVVGDD